MKSIKSLVIDNLKGNEKSRPLRLISEEIYQENEKELKESGISFNSFESMVSREISSLQKVRRVSYSVNDVDGTSYKCYYYIF